MVGSATDRPRVIGVEHAPADMNDLYFACTDCKIIADCGYRWAYWHLLHPGVVRPRERIDVRRVLEAEDYWNPPAESERAWLYDAVFPSIRTMLAEHGKHDLSPTSGGWIGSRSNHTRFRRRGIWPRLQSFRIGKRPWLT